MEATCSRLAAGERGVIRLASALNADLVLMDERQARRLATSLGLSVAGSIAILERGAQLRKIGDLRSVYQNLLEHGIRFDQKLLEQSLARLGQARLRQFYP